MPSSNKRDIEMSYTVKEWSPLMQVVVAEVETLQQAEDYARACYQAQITSPAWESGYVTTWAGGGASAKYFHGGEIPEDAALLAARLDSEVAA